MSLSRRNGLEDATILFKSYIVSYIGLHFVVHTFEIPG